MFRVLLSLGSALPLLVIAAGCGGGDDGTPTPATPQTGAIGAIVSIEGEGSEPLVAELALPEDAESPPVVVLAGAGPSRQDWSSLADSLVDNGYAVLAVEVRENSIFEHRDRGSQCLFTNNRECAYYVDDVLRDIYAAVTFVRSVDEVDGSRVAVAGSGVVANVAYIASAAFGEIGTVISISPWGYATEDIVRHAAQWATPHSVLYIGTEIDSAVMNGLSGQTAEPKKTLMVDDVGEDQSLVVSAAAPSILDWLSETL